MSEAGPAASQDGARRSAAGQEEYALRRADRTSLLAKRPGIGDTSPVRRQRLAVRRGTGILPQGLPPFLARMFHTLGGSLPADCSQPQCRACWPAHPG
jgi:hypothetical protein